jgi:hypothetical protein
MQVFKNIFLFLALISSCLLSYQTPRDNSLTLSKTEKESFKLIIQTSYFSNLFNVIDNLSLWGPRTDEKYKKYWKEKFDLSKDDEDYLKEYVKIRKKYRGRFIEDDELQNLIASRSLVPIPPRDSDLGKKFILLFAGSRDIAEFKDRAEILMTMEDRNTLFSIIEHFKPRFDEIWENTLSLHQKAEELSNLSGSEHVREMLDSLAAFLGLKFEYPLEFEMHLLWSPNVRQSHGQVVERYSLVEVDPDEDMAHEMDKHIHEICHYLYDAIPPESKINIINHFFKEDSIEGPLAYNIFYESLAVGIAQGLFIKKTLPEYFDFQKSWYADPEIDAYGKALFPLLEEYFESGKTIDDRFVLRAVDQYKKAFKGRSIAPVSLLRYSFLFFRQNEVNIQRFKKRLAATSLWERSLDNEEEVKSFFHTFQGISGLVILKESDLSALRSIESELPRRKEDLLKSFSEEKCSIYAQKRKINGYIFWICSPEKRLEEALNTFLNLKNIPKEPIIF